MYSMLVADDSAIELECIVFLIEKYDLPFRVQTALNGEDALSQMQKQAFDVLLTDIQMPFMDGLELIEKTLLINPDTQIVIISAYENFEYAKTAMRLGVREYLLKPLDPTEFCNVMNNLISNLKSAAHQEKMDSLKSDYVKNHLLLQLLNDEALVNGDTVLLFNAYFRSYNNLVLIEAKENIFSMPDFSPSEIISSKEADCFYYLNMTPSLSLLMLDDQHLAKSFTVDNFCKYLADAFRSSSGVSVRVSYGAFASLAQLPHLYRQLEELLENSFLFPRRTVLPLELYGSMQEDKQIPALKNAPSSMSGKIREVQHYITKHYGEDLSLEKLAELIYIHPDYLSRLFKKETGSNLNQFIKQYRMAKAKELLINTQMRVSSVGTQVGYPNSSYFSKTFNDYFGLSPEKFREIQGMEVDA